MTYESRSIILPGEWLEKVREKRPLIHNITNYVTAESCANILLAAGASPIMADAPEEAGEIAGICDGLNMNMGTFSNSHLAAMTAAGRSAVQKGAPVLLDPVGLTVSDFRKKGTRTLIGRVNLSAVRGNFSEISSLAKVCMPEYYRGSGGDEEPPALGVDAGEGGGEVSRANVAEAEQLATAVAGCLSAVCVITGEIDVVSDGSSAVRIYNGCPMMKKVTGCGCQLSALVTAFLAAAPGKAAARDAAASAVCAMGVCGEIAFESLKEGEGSGMYGKRIIDAMYNLNGEVLNERARYEIRQF